MQIDELDIIEYFVYLRDGFIYRLSQTSEGQKYLNDAWRIQQEDFDDEKLKRVLNQSQTRG